MTDRLALLAKILLVLFLTPCSAAFAEQAFTRVLLLNSYHPQYSWTRELIKGVTEQLKQTIPEENIHIEFMDARRFVGDGTHRQMMIALLNHKYRHFLPDMILTSDDAAFNFVLEYGDELFPGVPVGFMGVNVFDPASVADKPHVFGIAEGMAVQDNLELIRQVLPGVRKVVLLADQTELGSRMVQRANEVRSNYDLEKLLNLPDIEVWDDFSIDGLYQRVKQLPPDNAILMLAIHKDNQGNYFSFNRDIPELTAVSPVPVFGMWGGGLMLGRGILGGAMNDPRQQGIALAEMAQQILAGTDPQEIGIMPSSVFSPHFDYSLMKRFGLSQKSLPPDSTVINREPSYFETHKEIILTSAAVVTMLSCIIVVLSVNIRRRVFAERHLTLLKQDLEKKVEEQTEALRTRNSKLEQLSRSMTQLAHTDALTGLPNRRALNELLKSAIKGIKGCDYSHTVVAIDIDNFKTINDMYGHDVGDEVLIVVARTMRNSLRPQDVIGRWGGEEFLAIMDETDPRLAHAPSERMRKAVEAIDHFDFDITISLGIAGIDGYSDKNAVLKKADQMMYRAKQRGKNQTYLDTETLG